MRRRQHDRFGVFGTDNTRAVALLVLLVAALVAACGGGGGGSPTAPPPPGPPPPPPPPAQGILFTPNGAPGSDTIHLDGNDTADTTSDFTLEVRASQVTDLYGVSFDLEFPEDLLTFRRNGVDVGSFLEAGGVEPEILVKRQGDTLVIGISRIGNRAGVDGSGVLFTIRFRNGGKAGDGAFRFRSNNAVDSEGNVIEATDWIAGSVEVKL